MSAAHKQYQRRKDAQKALDELFAQPATVNFVHYSCEGFYDRAEWWSPRITSIAVRNMASRQTASFSMHQQAERAGLPLDEIDGHYDELERKMLDEFYEHVRRHPNFWWVQWNMLDSNYGFPALAHRYRVRGGDPVDIPESRLFDLSSRLIDTYGPGYIGQPRMTKLLELNGWSTRGFLSGADEATAFTNREYVKLHQSTLKKVDVIQNIAGRAWDGTLKTNATWRDQHGASLVAIIDGVTQHWLFKVLGAGAILVTLAGGIIYLVGPRGAS